MTNETKETLELLKQDLLKDYERRMGLSKTAEASGEIRTAKGIWDSIERLEDMLL